LLRLYFADTEGAAITNDRYVVNGFLVDIAWTKEVGM
jgi:hypothetical protein